MEIIEKLTPILIALFTLLGTWYTQHSANEKRLREEREQNRKQRELERERYEKELKLIEATIVESKGAYRDELDKLIVGTTSIIRNDILDICREAISKQYIDIYTLETLSGLYKSYKDFGGNSVVEDLYLATKALPVIDERMML